MTTPHNIILIGHVQDKIKDVPDGTIDMCITSPPYWGLRDYGDDTNIIWDGDKDCDHKWGSPQNKGGRTKRKQDTDPKQTKHTKNEFLQKFENFCSVCGAWKGQLGLEPSFNLYIQHLVQIFEAIKPKLTKGGTLWVNLGDTYSDKGKMRKSLIGIPDRFKITMIDSGWICRNEIHWHKPNVMPASVKDRFTVDFEKIFMFSKNKKYYFKQQFEPMTMDSVKRERRGNSDDRKYIKDDYLGKGKAHSIAQQRDNIGYDGIDEELASRKGRNMRTTWTITTKGYKGAHFAIFPEELVRVPIEAGCPDNGIILDPFMGSGTTAIVAEKQNKNWIGIELNPEYAILALKRIQKYRMDTK